MTARRIAVVVGIGWMALIGALGAWLGFSEAFLGATGLIFEGGYGEIENDEEELCAGVAVRAAVGPCSGRKEAPHRSGEDEGGAAED